MHYSTKFHKALVCQITPQSSHIPRSISKPPILSCKIYKILTTVIQEGTSCKSLKSSILKVSPHLPPRSQQSPILVFTDVGQNTAHSYYSRQVLFSCLKPSSLYLTSTFQFPKGTFHCRPAAAYVVVKHLFSAMQICGQRLHC